MLFKNDKRCSKKLFSIKNNEQSGILFKCNRSQGHSPQWIFKHILQKNPNTYIFMTMPTVQIPAKYYKGIYPGHNLVCLMDNNSQVISCISKRANTKKRLEIYTRAPDTRLTSYYVPKVPLYAPIFTSVQEELQKWWQYSAQYQEYPLFLHIIACDAIIGITPQQFVDNVEDIRRYEEPYSLYTYIHPATQYSIPASNCNVVTHAAFGLLQDKKPYEQASIAAMCCQESVIQNIMPFIGHPQHYIETINRLQLVAGIQRPNLDPASFYPCSR